MATELIGIGGQAVELKLTKFEKRLLSRFRAETLYNRFGKMATIGARQGKSINFRRMESIYPAGNASSLANASAPAALTEGTPGAEMQATFSEVAATVAQYGQWARISDMVETQSIDDVVAEYTENFAESMRDGLDTLTRDVLVSATNVQFASVGTSLGNVGSGMYLNLAELREAKRTLKRNNARPLRREDGLFVVITHPDAMTDLEADSNITNIWQYAGERGKSNELFDVSFKTLPMGFRVFETTNARIHASLGLSGADNVSTFMLAEEAYGVISLEALPARVIRKARGSGGTSDPLDQISTIGWKAAHAAVILNQANLVRIVHNISSKTAA